MTTQPPSPQASRQERSLLLISCALLWIAIGTFLAVTHGIPYVDYGLSWQARIGIFAVPALLLLLMSGYLQLSDLKELVRMVPKIRFETRNNDQGRVSHDQDGS